MIVDYGPPYTKTTTGEAIVDECSKENDRIIVPNHPLEPPKNPPKSQKYPTSVFLQFFWGGRVSQTKILMGGSRARYNELLLFASS